MMTKFGESGHPVFRATSPTVPRTLRSKGGGKLLIQLSTYGAVSDLCEEYKTCQVRAGYLYWQGRLLTKTPTPSIDDPEQEDLLQKYQERMKRLSQQNRVIKICTDAGFLTTVGVGQYFMT